MLPWFSAENLIQFRSDEESELQQLQDRQDRETAEQPKMKDARKM